jgi:stage II sporulation protein D
VKRALITLWLLLVSVSAIAQQRTVKVRLFWQHPPAKIRVESAAASLKACPTCPTKPLSSPADFIGTDTRTAVVHGIARISGDGFYPFSIDGDLTIQPREGILLVTLDMPLEEYVAAVLAGESAGFKSDEALKAMAVAARTYAVHFGSRHNLEGFDFCDTTHCQDVRLGNESSRVRAAVAATQGELLWYQGKPGATFYHRSCGGELEEAATLDASLHVPYLRQHQDQYCSRSDEWHVEIAKPELSRALARSVNTVAVGSRSESGRVRIVLINGHPFNATDVRLRVGRALGWEKIRSDLYELQDHGDRIVFRGRGQGHGVGLCQVGADNMGKQRHSYREILAYYYPGTTLGINAQGLAWQRFPGAAVDIVSTSSSDVGNLLPIAESALHFATSRAGSNLRFRPQVKVYPTISIYRDATGEPGWVAASTRGNTIRLQPIETLRRTNSLDRTLRHEFLHMVIESLASTKTPLWLREGLVIYLEDPRSVKAADADTSMLDQRLRSAHTAIEMRSAYRASAAAVADLVAKSGLPAVVEAVKTGQLSQSSQ